MATKAITLFTNQGVDYTINDPNIADEFSTSTAYSIGDFVNYQGNLYRFMADHSAGSWDSSHVDRVKVMRKLTQEIANTNLNVSIINNKLSKHLTNWITMDGIRWTEGYISKNGGITTTTGRYYSDFILCSENVSVTYIAETNHSTIAGITFWDAQKRFILGYSNNGNLDEAITVTSPDKSVYCRLSIKESQLNTAYVNVATGSMGSIFDSLFSDNKFQLQQSLIRGVASKNILPASVFNQRSGVTTNNDGSYTIAAGGYLFGRVEVYGTFSRNLRVQFRRGSVNAPDSPTTRAYIPSEPGTYHAFNVDGQIYYVDYVPSDFDADHTCLQVRIDNRNGSSAVTIRDLVGFVDADYYIASTGAAGSGAAEFYISPSGSDVTGTGTSESPFKTATYAINSGASKIVVKPGVYEQTIDLLGASSPDITFVAESDTARSIFVHPDSLIATSATSVSGYTNVKKVTWSTDIGSGIRLYQDGSVDVTTLISDAERNSHQRGLAYRMQDTKIIPCTSTTVDNALAEINNVTGNVFHYFHDTANNTLYFSCPDEVSESKPIRYCPGTSAKFLNGTGRNLSLKFYGIECKYMSWQMDYMAACHLEDCKAANIYGAGGFVYNYNLATEFVRCEVCGVYYSGSSGDGFNGHNNTTGDPKAKASTCRLVDCWSHDNADDGYSDHERAEIEVYGGLYEYNGKAGITPSYGSHCSCYGVTSRRNYSGFYCVGEATEAEGGKYTQMTCISCIAENNNYEESGYGFVVGGDGNSARLVNCKSIGNNYGYFAKEDTTMELIDCGEADSVTDVTGGSGTITTNNTTLVTVS